MHASDFHKIMQRVHAGADLRPAPLRVCPLGMHPDRAHDDDVERPPPPPGGGGGGGGGGAGGGYDGRFITSLNIAWVH
jgi:hypothetical protein